MQHAKERSCVGALLCRDGRILLTHRDPSRDSYPGVWDVPGGHLLKDEEPTQTLRRELIEEIGVMPKKWRRLGTFRLPDVRVTLHLYVVIEWEGEPVNRAPHEHDQLRWFSAGQLGSLDLADQRYRPIFQRLLQPPRQRGWPPRKAGKNPRPDRPRKSG